MYWSKLFYEAKQNRYLANLAYQNSHYKRDGYRQQNVRQRQKLIINIDYDVCILENLQPFWRYSASKNILTLKTGLGFIQGHWKWHHLIDRA